MWNVIELNFVLILFLIIRSQQIWRMLQQHNCYVCVMWNRLDSNMNERKTKGLTNLNSDEKIIRDTCVSLARMYFSQFAAISCSIVFLFKGYLPFSSISYFSRCNIFLCIILEYNNFHISTSCVCTAVLFTWINLFILYFFVVTIVVQSEHSFFTLQFNITSIRE